MSSINEVTRRLGGIPPDPEGMNEARSNNAKSTLTFFCHTFPIDWNDGLADLMTNLMHMCDRLPNNLKLNFEEELERARRNYETETTAD
jgi:hypothetical protein